MTEPYYQIDPSAKKRDPMLLGYVRVSTTEQARQDRTSMKEQERIINGYGMMKDIPSFNTMIFRDPGVSGATPVTERPAGMEILKVARPGDIICASKLDRMFRSAIDALQTAQKLKKAGINLVLLDMGDQPVTSNGMAQCFFTMAAAFAELERVRIAERMADGKRAKVEKGGHIGGLPPYGFEKVGKGRESKLIPNLVEQNVMQTVVRLSTRMTPTQIIRYLRKAGIRPRLGNDWQSVQILRICRHGRRLWPELVNRKNRIKGTFPRVRPPKEIVPSEDGLHETRYM
jgi:DNA invertase Pin-like site-specific DNA recombinase